MVSSIIESGNNVESVYTQKSKSIMQLFSWHCCRTIVNDTLKSLTISICDNYNDCWAHKWQDWISKIEVLVWLALMFIWSVPTEMDWPSNSNAWDLSIKTSLIFLIKLEQSKEWMVVEMLQRHSEAKSVQNEHFWPNLWATGNWLYCMVLHCKGGCPWLWKESHRAAGSTAARYRNMQLNQHN